MAVDPRKVAAIRDCARPTSEVRRFVGLANYYRRFVRHESVLFASGATYKLMQPSGYFSLDRHGTAELRGTSSGSDVRPSPPGVGPGSPDPTHD